MSEKKTSTPKEIPLHEVVLAIMYQANKERPAQLTIAEVYAEVPDKSISEIRIFDVLQWLVGQKEVEIASGKYSLDRFSFLDERKKDAAKRGEESLTQKDVPLHDVVLNAMFEADKDKPVKLTSEDIFWKISDPKVLRTHLGDVLKWLVNQHRIEYLGGKYSLDDIEFLSQKKEVDKKSKVEKPVKKKKQTKEVKEEAPKIVIPPAPKAPKPEKVEKVVPESIEEKEAPIEHVEKSDPKPTKETTIPEKQVEKKAPEPAPVQKTVKKSVEASNQTKQPEIAKPVTPKKVEVKTIVERQVEITEQAPKVQPRWRKPMFTSAIGSLILVIVLLFVLIGSTPIGADNALAIMFGLFTFSSLALILIIILFYRQE